MGGMQQIGQLIRKNAVLKLRRPRSTCFELVLPIVLFVLLIVFRSLYEKEIEVLGPFHYEPRSIFPLSRELFAGDSIDDDPRNGPESESAAGANVSTSDGEDDADDEGVRAGGRRATIISELRQQLFCDSSLSDTITEVLAPILAVAVDQNDALRDMLQTSTFSRRANESLAELQSFDVASFVNSLDNLRRSYLDTHWAAWLEQQAEDAFREWSLRNGTDSAGDAATPRRRAEGWVNDTCSLGGPVFNGWNTSAFAADLDVLRGGLLALGTMSWTREAFNSTLPAPRRNLSNMTADAIRLAEEMIPKLEMIPSMLQELDLGFAAAWVDDAVWWSSHFLQSDSEAARLLDDFLGSVEDISATPPGMLVPNISFRTGVGRRIFQSMRGLQHGLMEGINGSNLPQPGWNISSVADMLRPVLGNLTSYNATAMVEDVLPAWASSWRSACSSFNATGLVDVLARMQRGCPFYRSLVNTTGAGHNFSGSARAAHARLAELNMTDVKNQLEGWQNAIRSIRVNYRPETTRHSGERAPREQHRADVDLGMAADSARALADQLLQELQERLRESAGVRCHSRSASRLVNGRVLVAPYSGEVRRLLEFMFVELVLSATGAGQPALPAGLRDALAGDGGSQDPPAIAGSVSSAALELLLQSPLVQGLAARLVDSVVSEYMVTFASERDLEEYASDHPQDVFAALVFRSADPATGDFPPGGLDVRYAVRLHAQVLPPTSKIIRRARHGMFGGSVNTFYPYIDFGFVYLQDVVGRATIRLRAHRTRAAAGDEDEVRRNIAVYNRTALAHSLTVDTQQFPTPQYRFDGFIFVIQYTLPLVMILGWIYAVSLLTKDIVYEKQERLREVMRIMGLRTWVYWASWVTSAMIQLTVLVLIITVMMVAGRVLLHSNPVLVFMYFWCYSGAVVSLAMAISAFFSRAKVAAAFAGLIYYAAYLPCSLYNRYEETMSLAGKCLMCLLAPTGQGVGMAIIAKWELVEEGLQWHNLGLPPPVTNTGAIPNNNFSLLHVFFMLLVDMFLYQFIAWYVEKVFPGTLGLPQPWYFLFLPSYWRGAGTSQGQHGALYEEGTDGSADAEKRDNKKLECWEPPPVGLEATVRIRKLAKTYGNGKKALRGISFDMHNGTILGLLGHNGAGKSTTMAILTGLYPPSEGDVHVNGCSVRGDSHGVRKQLGVCLQQNALYELLTVEEHLSLFCNLKGVPKARVAADVDGLLQDTGLLPKRHTPSGALSGGMKRKLSIGIALAGGSQVIALDEPTAGVDAASRRDIWQLLTAHKARRSILLSTHFMDEADVLSDRIAIIAEGSLTAVGSSMALKKHFADSYMLTLVTSDGADTAKLLVAVQAAVPKAQSVGSRGREHSYALPASERPQFAALFASLQNSDVQKELAIDTYGLSAATMEEVFLQASSVHEESLDGQVRNTAPAQPAPLSAANASHACETTSNVSTHSGSTPSLQEVSEGNSDTASAYAWCPQCLTSTLDDLANNQTGVDAAVVKKPDPPASTKPKVQCSDTVPVFADELLLSGPRLAAQQFLARLRMRATSVRRDRRAWASQLILPALFVLLALIVARILEIKVTEPALKLSTDMFIGTVTGARASVSQHVIPGAAGDGEGWPAQVMQALGAAMGVDDVLEQHDFPGTGTSHGGMSRYLISNAQELSYSYGALSVDGSSSSANMTLWFKNRAYHAIPAMMHLCNNARLRLVGYEDTHTEAWSHPLPKTQQLLEEEMTGDSQVYTDLTVAITIILGMGFIPASFVVYIIHERVTNGKHQQLLTGVSSTLYWLSSYVWDMINFVIPVLCLFALFLSFQLPAYSGENSLAVFLLLLCYGACMTPLMYCLEPLFKVPSTAYVTLICANIFTGTVSVMATMIMEMNERTVPDLKPVNGVCMAIFPWLLPNYSLGRGLLEVAINHYRNYAIREFGACDISSSLCGTKDPLSEDVSGKFILRLVLMSLVWLMLRLLIEWKFFLHLLHAREGGVQADTTNDKAVSFEASRVADALQEMSSSNVREHPDRLLISKLSKSFLVNRFNCCRQTVAVHSVRGISVGVAAGECFGLLGVNGAGKTTTMRMITGDTEIGHGDIFVSGWSMRSHRDQARRHLGYCPQFDALPDKLTVRETLRFYASIRGVPADQVACTANDVIRRMCLGAHEHRLCQHLSGGNKRKLSTALALIGEPDVVLLDEPSTGIDVGARRFLWEVLEGIRKSNRALVLTSHSMDECEVLCTRLTIMVSGEFRCLGSPLQLKTVYGGGYTLMVKASHAREQVDNMLQVVAPSGPHEDPCAKIREYVARAWPAASLVEENVGLLRYHVAGGEKGNADVKPGARQQRQEVPLADIFQAFEAAMSAEGKLHGCVSDYILSQTSLEDVFLHFTLQSEGAPPAPPAAGLDVVPAEPVCAEA